MCFTITACETERDRFQSPLESISVHIERHSLCQPFTVAMIHISLLHVCKRPASPAQGQQEVCSRSVLLCSMAAASGSRPSGPVHTISRFVCVGCESQGEFRHTYASRRGASVHASKTPACRRLGLGIREIRVPAGSGLSAADVMAGGGGAAGPAPDVRHQPLYKTNYDIPGYPELSQLYFPQYPEISQDIPGYPKLSPFQIPRYPEISRDIRFLSM